MHRTKMPKAALPGKRGQCKKIHFSNVMLCANSVRRNGSRMRKKIIVCIIAAAVLLIPIPRHYEDGGTVAYRALAYSIYDVHSLNPDREAMEERPYVEGIIVEIFGIEVFNNVK